MDLWFVAAAAGVGCIAKNLPNFNADRKESTRGPSLKYVQTESRNFLQQLRDKTCPLRRLAQQRGEDDSLLDLENHSDVNGDYHPEKSGILEGYNLSAGVVDLGENQQLEDGRNMNLGKAKLARNRRCRIRPLLTSLGTCVDNMEQHSSCLHPPSLPPARPVLVTDAMWGENSCPSQSGACLDEKGRESKTLSSPLKLFEELKKPSKGSSRSSRSQGAEALLLFITGMTVGIVTATTSWKNEVDGLGRKLTQMHGLVQDLQDELDLNEVVTVKELDMEGNLPPGEVEDSPLSTVEPVPSPSLVEAGGTKASDDNKAENLELLSRIEAELQAELEVLELNMNVSDQDGISSVVELDPDFELEIVRGELKPAMVDDATESESRTTDTTADCSKPVNYSVSPWELSLRLHELIESRLEARIKDLEIALSQSKNRVGIQHRIVSGRRYSYSETESSSAHHSPTCICDEHAMREDEPSENDGESGSNSIDRGGRSTNGLQNGNCDSMKDMPQIWDNKQTFMSLHTNEDSMSEDEGSDESEMLLIKQILERRKSGSGFNFKF
ncbi:hypothetical protein AAHA92_19010 [Salvia divinorum]|uniref:Uncharacterized protein n=1 Tax=Salvia divinorum TaxID=28513 RepID=A0ABD1H3Y4_SALDI